MTKHKETLVLFTLAIANTPLTISELAFRTGKSYNTVKTVLSGDDRVSVLEGHPTRYYLAKPDVLDEQVVRLQGDTPKEGWVKWAESVSPLARTFIKLDKGRAPEDVANQAVVLEALGTNLLLMGRQLKEHADKPDWFTLMGGDENA